MTRVLIVDDDEDARLLVHHILESAGHELYLAENGAEAMRLFLRETPEVVITDLQMPGSDGIDLIGALVATSPDVPIIAITGSATEFLRTARMMGARTTLEKPVSPRALLDAVAEATRGTP